jgi:hypothetical protein
MFSLSTYNRILLSILLTLTFSLRADTDTPEPDRDTSNLEIIEQNRYGEILVARDVDWSRYSHVQIEVASVEFRDRWIHDQRWRSGNIIREKDEIRIKAETADLVLEVLGRELSKKGGYVITEEEGPDVMQMTIRVVGLDIVAPDRVRNHIGSSFTDSQLNMKLELDIFDSADGELLATSWQHQEDPYKGYMEWTTSPTNRRAASLMLERWSSWLIEGLEKASNGK